MQLWNENLMIDVCANSQQLFWAKKNCSCVIWLLPVHDENDVIHQGSKGDTRGDPESEGIMGKREMNAV